jgi:hypothetical protein
MKTTLLAAIALGATTLLFAKDRSLTLEFVPQEATGAHAPVLGAGMTDRAIAIRFEDARTGTDPDVVGQGTEDDDKPFSWKATSSVPKFAEDALRKGIAEWGIKVDASADMVLVVRLQRFYVTEHDQAVGSTYGSEVRVAGALESRSGAVVANGTGSGSANRYGRKRSGENSDEVLSDALKEAYARLLDDPAIQAAWSGRPVPSATAAASPSASPKPAGSVTPSSLLEEIKDLEKQGFSDDLLIRFLHDKTLSTRFGAEDLKAWKAAGLDEKVIEAAMDRAP